MTRTVLKAGDVLGRFQLLVPIGEGGMGRVWVAREQGFAQRPRLVAIKTALAEDAAADEYWKVLLDEARIASQVQHPNVCAIHALDRERGVVYLVMDWSDGGSLRELLDGMPERRLDFPLAARITAHVCAGLHAAHELAAEDGSSLGVVHRDVSPQNILLSGSGQVKITDFGVAKARGQLHAATQTGEVKGKLSYMAPEQVTTRDVDRRADVFALGCVLYEASTGQRAFHGGDALATLYQLLEQPLTPPSERLPGYPAGLERIVLKSLERDPEKRYATTEDMGRALEGWLASERAMVSDSKIAEVVASSLGERMAKRLQNVEAALAVINAPAVPEPEPERPNFAETLSGSAASTDPEPPTGGRRPRKAVWASLAALAAVLSLGVALAARRSEGDAPPPAATVSTAALPPAASATAPPTPIEPGANVVITVRAVPAEAAVFLDDGPALPNPHYVTVTPDSRPHRVRAAASGYADSVQEVAFDRSKEIVVVLREQTPGVRKPSGARPVAGTPTVTPSATPTRKLGELPPVTKKPPRSLDSDNPFAQP